MYITITITKITDRYGFKCFICRLQLSIIDFGADIIIAWEIAAFVCSPIRIHNYNFCTVLGKKSFKEPHPLMHS